MVETKVVLEAIDKVVDRLFKYLGPVSLASIAVLLIPATWLQRLGLDRVVVDQRGVFGGVAVLGASAFLWWAGKRGVAFAGAKLTAKRVTRRVAQRRRAMTERLVKLTTTEKAILRDFLLKGERAILLPVDRPEVQLLINDRILALVSHTGQATLSGQLFSVRISSEAADVLTRAHLDIPESPTEQDLRRLVDERPAFLESVDIEQARMERLSRY